MQVRYTPTHQYIHTLIALKTETLLFSLLWKRQFSPLSRKRTFLHLWGLHTDCILWSRRECYLFRIRTVVFASCKYSWLLNNTSLNCTVHLCSDFFFSFNKWVGPLYPWVSHPQIQPTADRKHYFHNCGWKHCFLSVGGWMPRCKVPNV